MSASLNLPSKSRLRQGSIDNTVTHETVSEIRMRERMSMKSKMLGALALLTLIGALFVIQSADQYTPTADAATGSIAALNVGTCLTTSEDVFGKADCDLSGNGSGDDPVKWEVRKDVVEVSTLYATYAHDPKTSSDAPRAILMDSDLLKISIADTGRDKRTGVLIAGASLSNMNLKHMTNTALATAIKTNLDRDELNYPTDTSGDIQFNHANNSGVAQVKIGEVTSGGGAPATSTIMSSGNKTLNIGGTVVDPPGFLPGDFNVQNGAVVRFYGCVDMTRDNDCGDSGETIEVLDELEVDEDASNGEAHGNTAPWLGVNASVPDDSNVLILAVYYRTSNQEDLVGGKPYYYCSDSGHTLDENNDVWTCDDPMTTAVVETVPALMRDGEFDVVYTTDEKDRNTALMVQASADGDLEARSVNLHLKETARFNGVYQGFIRLTDANADGRQLGAASTVSTTDWGRKAKHGSGSTNTASDVAVLAVDGGPVTIDYRDSGGSRRMLRIEIDNVAPSIAVTSPTNGSSSDDQSPDFAGTLEDADSGLVDNSFRLVVDNRVDGEGKNDDWVLTGRAPDITVTASGSLTSITRIEEYAGYTSTDPLFGIVSQASDLYDLGDDSCDDQNQCHILADAYDDGASSGTFEDDLRLDLQDSSGDAITRDKEFEIDFQAFVMDMAGNIGFSDSDPANPRYINDLGTKADDRKKPNVLGYYSAHIVTLDEKDPVIQNAKTATGYFGLNSDGDPIVDRSGVMVVFDGPIAASSVSTGTFSVELDDGTAASIVDARVEKKYAFLKLDSELASDATPKIDITQGEKVEDMAGNETFGREVDEFEANDGISPRLTVTLSGGSGSGTGDEGPDKLTKNQITVNVSSDEELQGAPKIHVVCSTLRWNEGANADVKKDIDDFVANRNTSSADEPTDDNLMTTPDVTGKNAEYDYTCDYTDPSGVVQEFVPGTPATGLSRPGENWDHTWKKGTVLEDGKLTVVAYARDRSRYEFGDELNVQNWGSTSTEFTLDTGIASPKNESGGNLQPGDGEVSKEDRPHVLIEFNEGTTVTLDSVELDGVEIADQFDNPQMNRFIYWPESLARGAHEVEAEASDAAGNEVTFDYKFTVEARGKFLVELQAGWNAISVPADPIDTAIGSVFTDPAIERVIGWDTQGWRIAVRRDGVWESNHQYRALNEIRAKYGYWVKSSAFIDQPVALKGPISRNISGAPTLIGIDTLPGWNFVGVIDQEGDQTEGNDFGTSLIDSQDNPVKAGEYLGPNYVRAYTWDPTFSQFESLRSDNDVTIGDGVWVYYPETGGIAP